MELESVRKELELVESRSTTFEYKINSHKDRKQISDQHQTQDTLAIRNILTLPSGTKLIKKKKNH